MATIDISKPGIVTLTNNNAESIFVPAFKTYGVSFEIKTGDSLKVLCASSEAIQYYQYEIASALNLTASFTEGATVNVTGAVTTSAANSL